MFGKITLTVSKAVLGTCQINTKPAKENKSGKKLWVLGIGLLVIACLAGVLMAPQATITPQDSDSLLQLGIKYTVEEHMVYNSTSDGITTIDILGFDGQRYSLNVTTSGSYPKTGGYYTSPTGMPTLTIAKSEYYKNFLPEGQPSIFNDVENNPALAAYVTKTSVNIGDVWAIPVTTDNSTYGWIGDIIVKFCGVQNITVPAGSYEAFAIEISSSNLSVQIDPDSSTAKGAYGIQNVTYQLHGTTYLEQGTCRLIKFNLASQQTIFYTNGKNATSNELLERTLIEHQLH